MYIPDNADLFEMYDAEHEEHLKRLPVCCYCEEHIQQESALRINGNWYCDNCLDDMREDIE